MSDISAYDENPPRGLQPGTKVLLTVLGCATTLGVFLLGIALLANQDGVLAGLLGGILCFGLPLLLMTTLPFLVWWMVWQTHLASRTNADLAPCWACGLPRSARLDCCPHCGRGHD